MMRTRFVLTIAALLLVACGKRCESSASSDSDVPVFIISIDTLRADRLPVYGYPKGSTPAIDVFRRDAILFRHAFSQCPLTLPSHVSLLTGEPPYVHGVRNNLGYTLDVSKPSLASILKGRGYETGAAVSSFVLRKETGIAAGFDFFDDAMTFSPHESATSWQRDGNLSREILAKWLDATRSRRIFGFLHLYEPHSPYTPPKPYSTGRDSYDGEISYADSIVGTFLGDLKSRGLYDSALIVVLSDHGEGLGDHGEKEHGIFLYRESIHVPLLVKLPGQQRKGETIDTTVALTDIVPTILDVIGENDPRPGLLASASRARSVYSESYYPRLQYGWSELVSAIGPDLHYIHAPHSELYRYRVDAAERDNIAAEHRRELASFRREIQDLATKYPFAQPRIADPEDVKKLAALGYVGSTVSASGALPDPKDKLDVLHAFGAASDHIRLGRLAEAEAELETLMRANPDFVSGWGLLSQVYRKRGKNDRALEALRMEMKQSPGNPQVALAIADLLLEMRRYTEARQHAELAKGSGVFAHETLAMIALAERDYETAEREVAASLTREPDRVQSLILQSQICRAQQRLGEELAALDKAREIIQQRKLAPIRDLERRRGEALLRLQRVSEAEQAFRAETQAFDSNLQAWGNLALVVAAQGRRPEARAILEECMRRNPGRAARAMAVEALSTMGDTAGARELQWR